MEAEQRRDAADLELLERAQHAPARVLAVGAVDDELRDHRVVERRDLAALDDPAVHAHAWAGRLAVVRDPPGRGQEPARDVLGVDPALERVAGEPHVLLAERERLARGDQDLLAHEVDPGHELRHGVLDLDARVHLEEEVLALAREQPLDRPGRAVADGARGVDRDLADPRRAARRRRRARASPRRASGAAAGSCSRARRGARRCRAGRRAPAPRRGAGPRGSARRRRQRRRSTPRPRAAPTRTRAPRRRRRARPSAPCRRRPRRP